MVVSSSQQILTDTWVKATWDEFVSVAYDDPAYTEGRAYFDAGYMRIEMASLEVGHGRQNGVVWDVITLFVLAKKLNIAKYANGSFCKSGEREFQPDAAFYIGDAAKYLPPQNNSPVSIDLFGPPTLIVEVGARSLSDDLGAKRILYERVGVQEYWVVDVEGQKVIAFSMAEGRSGQIRSSVVLPGLDMEVVEEALRRSQSENDGAIAQWLMQTFQ
jgi:Uma2 family endonuclease